MPGMKPKQPLTLALVLLSLQLIGQKNAGDTIRISEVVISARIKKSPELAISKQPVDSGLIAGGRFMTLGELLTASSGISFKNYGPGGISIPSFRGTSASHTAVTWNGITINNPMLGQADFSQLPLAVADNVSLRFGASSMEEDRGGIGGSVSLENKPDWAKGLSASIVTGAGSFGSMLAAAKISGSSSAFHFSTRPYINFSRNDFTYTDRVNSSVAFERKRKNSSFLQKGAMQEIWFRKGANEVSAIAWYNSTGRKLPGPIIAQSSGSEEQEDRSLRSVIRYTHTNRNLLFYGTAALVSDWLNYSNILASIDSRNHAVTATLKGGFRFNPGRLSNVDISLGQDIASIESNNYDRTHRRSITTLTASAGSDFGRRLSAAFLARQTLTDGKLLVPDFSMSVRYKIAADEILVLSSSISRNSRLASMNDLYWNPGGNTGLRNEYAWQAETGALSSFSAGERSMISAGITLFRNDIADMIQWLPGHYSYWQPKNVGKARTSGIETRAALSYKAGKYNLKVSASYSLTAARDITDGLASEASKLQMLYVPEHQGTLQFSLGNSILNANFANSYTGRRYISPDNSEYLDGYILGSADISYSSVIVRSRVTFSLGADNIYNTDYESVAYYPMPGRSFFIRLKLSI